MFLFDGMPAIAKNAKRSNPAGLVAGLLRRSALPGGEGPTAV
ncbi:hypothetical protein WHZ77_00605 [Bradyrhizobium sp. A5]